MKGAVSTKIEYWKQELAWHFEGIIMTCAGFLYWAIVMIIYLTSGTRFLPEQCLKSDESWEDMMYFWRNKEFT